MKIQENFLLKQHNTFGINVRARYFIEFNSENDILEYIEEFGEKPNRQLILGGGSNTLFTQNFDGYVLRNNLKGIKLLKETPTDYFVKVCAGENWHQFVLYCVERNYSGIENLSLIPGCVGASPIQNIGAYGVEAKDCIYEVEAIHLKDKSKTIFSNADCKFSYRNSIFKNEKKDNFIITSVTYKLSKKPHFKVSYGDIQKELEGMNVTTLNIRAISEAIIKIRSSKLPDYKKLGNCGSFFKNPVIENDRAEKLKAIYPEMPQYKIGGDTTKIPAAWLIEQCGWKGKRVGNCGVHDKHALVLVNYGGATGKEVYDLSHAIIESVENKFQISLEREVNII